MKGQPFVRNGKTLLSGIDPVRRAERTADAVSVRDRTLYLCPSPLYGYGLERLLSRLVTEAPHSALLCIEADPELYELTKKNIEPHLAANQKLCITNICETASLCAFVRKTWGGRAFRQIEMIRFTGGWQLYPELYDSVCEALRRETAVNWGNALTLAKLGRLYIRNALRNLALVPHCPSVENLSFGEAPVLVLGAGPSLDETLDALERRPLGPEPGVFSKERPFRIICVDTCLGALRDRNIVPDLAVILESQHWNLRDFTGCRGWEVAAAIDLSALPQSTGVLSGGRFLFMTPWTELRFFKRLKKMNLLPAVIPPLGSVGLTAVELARRLSRGNIICAGLDFSFNADRFHARSTPGHRNKMAELNRFRSLFNTAAYDSPSAAALSKSGLPVRSNPGLQNYRNLFEQEFASDPRIFDISGSGLPLGLKTVSQEEALSMLVSSKNTSHGGIEPKVREAQRAQREEDERKPESAAILAEKLLTFFQDEKSRLINLRNILTGETAADQVRLNTLVDECDYLWAHFPDYSGGGRPDLGQESSVSFLKRLRTEIEPALALIERGIKEAWQIRYPEFNSHKGTRAQRLI